MAQRTHVAVGVIYNSTKDRVLISKRLDHQHLAGYWEFPGGKVESNEDVFTALKRELYEELGITINAAKAYTKVSYDYPDKSVLLDVWKVTDWSDSPVSCEGQEIQWVEIADLKNYKFPNANKHIVQSILLNELFLISQESYTDYSHLFSVVEQCFSNGLRLFQLRLNTRQNELLIDIAGELSDLANQYNAKLILNGVAEDIEKYPVDGVHLKARDLETYETRPITEDYILGASCHSEEELMKAKKLNVNYAFLSPVLTTASHPDAVPLGWEKFHTLSQRVDFPLYALGGMKPSDLKIAQSYGAHGIAMLGAIWNSENQDKHIIGLNN